MKGRCVVVTGALSDVGRELARLLSANTTRVLLVDAPERAAELEALSRSMRGAEVAWTTAEPGRKESFERVAHLAERRFGPGAMTGWVNCAPGKAPAADALSGSLTDLRAQFESGFWSVVLATEVAVSRLRERGGTVVNVGSIHSDRAFPARSAEAVPQHAAKAWTDALRMELARERVPVEVSLVKAGLSHRYAPVVSARAVIACLSRPRRDLTVGGRTALLIALEKFLPALTDRLLLRAPRLPSHGPRRHRSLYTQLKLQRVVPWVPLLALAGAGAGLRTMKLQRR